MRPLVFERVQTFGLFSSKATNGCVFFKIFYLISEAVFFSAPAFSGSCWSTSIALANHLKNSYATAS